MRGKGEERGGEMGMGRRGERKREEDRGRGSGLTGEVSASLPVFPSLPNNGCTLAPNFNNHLYFPIAN